MEAWIKKRFSPVGGAAFIASCTALVVGAAIGATWPNGKTSVWIFVIFGLISVLWVAVTAGGDIPPWGLPGYMWLSAAVGFLNQGVVSWQSQAVMAIIFGVIAATSWRRSFLTSPGGLVIISETMPRMVWALSPQRYKKDYGTGWRVVQRCATLDKAKEEALQLAKWAVVGSNEALWFLPIEKLSEHLRKRRGWCLERLFLELDGVGLWARLRAENSERTYIGRSDLSV